MPFKAFTYKNHSLDYFNHLICLMAASPKSPSLQETSPQGARDALLGWSATRASRHPAPRPEKGQCSQGKHPHPTTGSSVYSLLRTSLHQESSRT